MYFEVENTPEHIKRKRNTQKKDEIVEEIPVLTLAAFSKPPIVVFENVPVGKSVERQLEICNPSTKRMEICLAKPLPAGVSLPGDCFVVDAQTKCFLTFSWTPHKPVVTRESITLSGGPRNRFDVMLVLKAIPVKPLKQKQTIKKTPKKIGILTASRKAPTPPNIAIKRQLQNNKLNKNNFFTPIASHSPNKKTGSLFINNRNETNSLYTSNYNDKENLSPNGSIVLNKCPFESFCSLPDTSCSLNFDNIDFFNTKMQNRTVLSDKNGQYSDMPQDRYLRTPIKKTADTSGLDVFDNIKFTPLSNKTETNRNDNMNVSFGEWQNEKKENTYDFTNKDIQFTFNDGNLTSNIENPFELKPREKIREVMDLSIDIEKNPFDLKPSERTHDVIDLERTSLFLKPPNFEESFPVRGKKASSPIKFNGIDLSFSLNHTEICTDLSFHPNRHSTERNLAAKDLTFDNAQEHPNEQTYSRLSSETYTKPDSPIVPLNPETSKNKQSSPYNGKANNQFSQEVSRRALNYNDENASKRNYRDRNSDLGVRSIIEAGLWQKENTPPPPNQQQRVFNRPLLTVPEETSTLGDSQFLDRTDKKQLTFVINQTFDKKEKQSLPPNAKLTWTKKSVKSDADVWKVPLPKPMPFQSLPDDINRESLLVTNNVYAQASTVDPFLSETYFYDERSVDKFEKEFKAWLNYILTPPADLDTNNTEHQHFDIGKAWIENRNKELPAAPTKEQVSSKYHDSHRLESLRKSAKILLNSKEIQTVYQKLSVNIERKMISIRSDRNIHLNVGLQKAILNLLLCYNPLWLRVALEAIYNTVIPLSSNSDICGLSAFIVQRMFKDPYLKSKHSNPIVPNVLLPSYTEHMNKFTLKKFFILVFFLDQAKQKKLIFHDPCLFSRNAQCKESREIIITFTRELIAGIGDITKHLRPLGYVVTHKQSFLDEFKFGVENIAVDLKDGIRLTKVMEVILVKPGLTGNLRTPAISRLQKIHNVQLALNALKAANFNITGDITAKDIVDGHREKTLSLLWQIIHVFRAPLFEKAAIVIQKWWKKIYLRLIIEKRIREREELRKHRAACVIQRKWRSMLYERMVQKRLLEVTKATIALQKYVRMWICRRKFLRAKKAVLIIEQWYINMKQIKQAEEILNRLLKEQKCATKIQLWFRRQLKKRYVETLVTLYKKYCEERRIARNEAATLIQKNFKRHLAVKKYVQVSNAVKLIQTRWRNVLAVREARTVLETLRREREEFLRDRAACVIQRKWRVELFKRTVKERILVYRSAAIVLQKNARMWICRKNYKRIKNGVLIVERWYLSMKQIERAKATLKRLKTEKRCVINIQRWYRKHLKRQHLESVLFLYQQYCEERKNIRNSAAMLIQKNIKRHLAVKNYIQISNAVKLIQLKWRGVLAVRQAKLELDGLRKAREELMRQRAACVIQRKWRTELFKKTIRKKIFEYKMAATVLQKNTRMWICKRNLRRTKQAVVCIENWYIQRTRIKHAKGVLQQLRTERKCAIKIQLWYRKHLKKRFIESVLFLYKLYCEERRRIRNEAATLIQKNFKRHLAVKNYIKISNAVKFIQSKWRDVLAIRQARWELEILRKERDRLIRNNAACIIQRKWRRVLFTRTVLQKIREYKMAAIVLQKNTRMWLCRRNYERTKCAVLFIEKWYINKMEIKLARTTLRQLKIEQRSAIQIQTWFRRILKKRYLENIKRLYENYCRERRIIRNDAATLIQKNYKRHLAVKRYIQISNAVKLIQTKWRDVLAVRQARCELEGLRREREVLKRNSAACVIQRKWRTELFKRTVKKKIFEYKMAATVLQKNARMFICRRKYGRIKEATLKIEKWYRKSKQIKEARAVLNRLRVEQKCAVKIQIWFRRQLYIRYIESIRNLYQNYCEERKNAIRNEAATLIQRNYKRHLAVKKYVRILNAAKFIQTRWRDVLAVRRARYEFVALRSKLIGLQAASKGYLLRKKAAVMYEDLQKRRIFERWNRAATKIQALWRGFKVRRDSCSKTKRVCEALVKHSRKSDVPSLAERNEHAIHVLTHMSDMASIIRAFDTLCLLTEVYPMIYNSNAKLISSRLIIYMSVSNRSISSLAMLQSGVAALTNLARYKVTGILAYDREDMGVFLKLFLRWCDKDSQLFCIMCTYLYLYSKYPEIHKDLTSFLKMSENTKIMEKSRQLILRKRRMEANSSKNKNCKGLDTNVGWSPSSSFSEKGNILPDLEPDFGLKINDKHRYFVDDVFAINTVFHKFFLRTT